jgi:asparaginyl-tRNA synthetase
MFTFLGSTLRRTPLQRRHISVNIKTLLSTKDVEDGKKVNVHGWIKTCRVQKKFTFIELTDGTTVQPLHVVVDSDKVER